MPSTKSDVHPYYGFILPRAIAMLARLPDDERSNRCVEAGLGCGRDPWLAQVGKKSPTPRADAGELGYVRWPFEVIPFAWQGGDGLTYAMLVHAPELSEKCPLVAHAPNDDPGCTWLGDDANEGLANLAAVALRKPDEYEGREDDVPEYRKEVDLAVTKITEKLGIKRVKDPKELTQGARSKRAAVPRLPKGWRHVPTVDRVGVVASAEAFAPGKQPVDAVVKDQAQTLARSRELIYRGFPATALLEARVVYTHYTADNGVAAALAMRDCYLALGRPFLAKRVDDYVASFSPPKKSGR